MKSGSSDYNSSLEDQCVTNELATKSSPLNLDNVPLSLRSRSTENNSSYEDLCIDKRDELPTKSSLELSPMKS